MVCVVDVSPSCSLLAHASPVLIAASRTDMTRAAMPHCGRQLYANLLEANWGHATLQRVQVLGAHP